MSTTSELGVPITTDPAVIAAFLRKRGSRVVFATYQSSPRIAEAQTGRVPSFDLAVADEAHRCTGPQAGVFATVLDSVRIKARRRVFMTATPRYFTGRLQREALEADWEVPSPSAQHTARTRMVEPLPARWRRIGHKRHQYQGDPSLGSTPGLDSRTEHRKGVPAVLPARDDWDSGWFRGQGAPAARLRLLEAAEVAKSVAPTGRDAAVIEQHLGETELTLATSPGRTAIRARN